MVLPRSLRHMQHDDTGFTRLVWDQHAMRGLSVGQCMCMELCAVDRQRQHLVFQLLAG